MALQVRERSTQSRYYATNNGHSLVFKMDYSAIDQPPNWLRGGKNGLKCMIHKTRPIAISRVDATLSATVSVRPSIGMTFLPSNCLKMQKK